MLPYQIGQLMAEQHVDNLMAEARRHELVAAARHARRERTEPSSVLKRAANQIRAAFHLSGSAQATSASASPSGAGPMGCAA